MFHTSCVVVILCSVFDLVLFFIVIETLSLCLYGLSTLFVKNKDKGAEAASKYLTLGLAASGFFGLGIVLIFFETGSTSFFALREYYSDPISQVTLNTNFGLFSLLFGFFFKLSVAPGNN